MVSIIVAVDEKMAIGRDGIMPWNLSDDLKRFKAITTGHTVVMGRNTWLSLPFKPLKNRRNIVISRTMAATEGCEIATSIEQALELCESDEKVFIIGGATIYNQLINSVDELIITHIHETFSNTDTFFPAIDAEIWQEKEKSELLYDEKSGLHYQYVNYILR